MHHADAREPFEDALRGATVGVVLVADDDENVEAWYRVRLPVVSGSDVVRALERSGYVMDRHKGSHIVLRSSAENPFDLRRASP